MYQFLTKIVTEVKYVTSSSVNTYKYRSDKISVSAYYRRNESPELATAIVFLLTLPIELKLYIPILNMTTIQKRVFFNMALLEYFIQGKSILLGRVLYSTGLLRSLFVARITFFSTSKKVA